jgi:hypothetical protein
MSNLLSFVLKETKYFEMNFALIVGGLERNFLSKVTLTPFGFK